jgi:hypothetical protein
MSPVVAGPCRFYTACAGIAVAGVGHETVE